MLCSGILRPDQLHHKHDPHQSSNHFALPQVCACSSLFPVDLSHHSNINLSTKHMYMRLIMFKLFLCFCNHGIDRLVTAAVN